MKRIAVISASQNLSHQPSMNSLVTKLIEDGYHIDYFQIGASVKTLYPLNSFTIIHYCGLFNKIRTFFQLQIFSFFKENKKKM